MSGAGVLMLRAGPRYRPPTKGQVPGATRRDQPRPAWRDRGKRAEARDLLARVYSWFTEGFDTQDLKDAKDLLNQLT